MRKERGFTLIELLVVLAIIGVLLLIAFPILTGVEEAAGGKACKVNQRTLYSAAKAYQLSEEVTGTVDELVTALYFPDTPSCPVDTTSAYTITWTGSRVTRVNCAGVPADHSPYDTTFP